MVLHQNDLEYQMKLNLFLSQLMTMMISKFTPILVCVPKKQQKKKLLLKRKIPSSNNQIRKIALPSYTPH